MKVRIIEDYDIGGSTFDITEDISKDKDYIFDIPGDEVSRMKKIIAKRKKIENEYIDVVHNRLYELKKDKDNELVEFVCPGCKHTLVLPRETVRWGCFKCYRCNCQIAWNEKEKRYYVHSGEGIASIDRRIGPYWTAKRIKENNAKKKQMLINRELQYKNKRGLL